MSGIPRRSRPAPGRLRHGRFAVEFAREPVLRGTERGGELRGITGSRFRFKFSIRGGARVEGGQLAAVLDWKCRA
ncbi:MAG: hypothetical protein JOZ39_07040 [Chloroflexi bacterium]|nr:hypothetical protein [Chloroflexota bacterium]